MILLYVNRLEHSGFLTIRALCVLFTAYIKILNRLFALAFSHGKFEKASVKILYGI